MQPLPPPLRGYSLTLRAREMNNLLGAERAGEVARSAGGVCRLGTEPSATTPSPAPRVLPHAFRAREMAQFYFVFVLEMILNLRRFLFSA